MNSLVNDHRVKIGSVASVSRPASKMIAVLRIRRSAFPRPNMSHDAQVTDSAPSRASATQTENAPHANHPTERAEVETAVRRPRGFAALDATARSAISRKGGQAAHRAGTAHKFTTDEAREAGKKGSQVTHARRRTSTPVT